MERIAADVHRIPLMPRDAVNAYLLGDVLVDSGYGSSAKRLVAAAREHGVGVHAITHAHPDHVGSSAAVAGAFGVPVWAGARDAPQVEAGSSTVRATSRSGANRTARSWPATCCSTSTCSRSGRNCASRRGS
jgi:hydroxyacylglutathione hydrolase